MSREPPNLDGTCGRISCTTHRIVSDIFSSRVNRHADCSYRVLPLAMVKTMAFFMKNFRRGERYEVTKEMVIDFEYDF